jgi:hypothetical protein
MADERDERSKHPRHSVHHDVLVITPRREYHRFPVNKVGGETGRYTSPPLRPGADEPGTRKVWNLAQQGTPDEPRGPAFSTLAVSPDPAASSCVACYLVNTENLRPINPWMAIDATLGMAGEASTSAGDAASENAASEDAASENAASENDAFEVLVAGPRGKVYFVEKRQGAAPTARSVDLSDEGELWMLLRNGLVAGRVEYRRHPCAEPRVVPVVNVTSLTPKRVDGSLSAERGARPREESMYPER